MPKSDWVVVDTVNGSLNAEILRGLLQAQGIEVLLSQEGAGRALGLEVGLMGDIDILVNSDDVPEARRLIDDYYSGTDSSEEDSEGTGSLFCIILPNFKETALLTSPPGQLERRQPKSPSVNGVLQHDLSHQLCLLPDRFRLYPPPQP